MSLVLLQQQRNFVSYQKKYIDIWKNELDFAVDKFNNIFNTNR